MRFILVDDILELTPGNRVRAVKTLAPGEELFLDHFPGFPVVPGVLLTEMMGQAAAKCLVAEDLDAGRPARGRPMLAQIKSATFRDWVRPGETITLIAEISTSRARFATAHCQAEVNARPVASAELVFTFQPASVFADAGRDEILERYLARTTDRPAPSGAESGPPTPPQ